MKKQFEQDKIAAQTAANVAANNAALKEWFQRNPTVVDCVANIQMFVYYMDFEAALQPEDFDFAFRHLKDNLALTTVHVPTPEEIEEADAKQRKTLKLPAAHEQIRRAIANNGDDLPDVWYNHDISTAESLKALARQDFHKFRMLVQRFGSTKIDARMGVVPQQQVATVYKAKF